MSRFLNKIRSAINHFGKSPRERYLHGAADLADLEFRQRNWDKMILDRDRYYRNGNF